MMTTPSDVKIREGTPPGTAHAAFEVGRQLAPVQLTVIREYATAVEADLTA
jgi:hypothetical protein